MKKKPFGLRRKLTDYGDPGFSLFLRKAFAKSMGYTDAELDLPVIGIVNTGSGLVSCHGTVPQLIEAVERGVTAAGGLRAPRAAARASARAPPKATPGNP